MKIGAMNKRITIKYVSSKTPDGMGGYTFVYSTLKETWSKVRPLTNRETLSLGLALGTRTYEFTVRFDGTLNQQNKIELNGRQFIIQSVINTDEANKEYKIIASERTD
jgi:SPP1 family predicted phage head-tail adaptor